MYKDKYRALLDTVNITSISILTPAIILTVAGSLIGAFCSNVAIAQLGTLIGRGATISCLLVLLVLPAYLYTFDRLLLKKQQTKEYLQNGIVGKEATQS